MEALRERLAFYGRHGGEDYYACAVAVADDLGIDWSEVGP